MTKYILFSEHESYYRELGLENVADYDFVFDGARLYKNDFVSFNRYEAFVCAFYTLPHNVVITLKFNRLGKKTILCSDGLFDFANAIENVMVKKYDCVMYHPIIQDFFLCIGSREKDYFNSSNGRAKVCYYLPRRVLSSKEIMNIPTEPRVLITTANTAYFNNSEFIRLKNLLIDAIDVLICEEIKFSLRIFDTALYRAISDKFDVILHNDISKSFENTVCYYSSVITTPSSVAITAMFQQRSVALLVYRDTPMLFQTGWLFSSKDVIKDSLSGFLSFDETRMLIQSNFLKGYLSDHNISENIINIVENNSFVSRHEELLTKHINVSLANMLDSKFNLNVEWFIRRIYLKFRHSKWIKKFKLSIR
ncbi:hypothetical protein [Agarivorans sp. QJM3NY_25]|uniref:hypothetical protein n=1 Tax=Agarivorans sp. QJM3NY_25 TaxID=3421430 RepID=UPI003D7EF501